MGRPKIDTPFASDAEVAEMIVEFEACRWPYARWTHRAHLGVALDYLRQYPFDIALKRVRHHILLYNRTCGDPDGYHETITIVFLRRAAYFLHESPSTTSLAAAIEILACECDLRWLLTYYSDALLKSAETKTSWVEPDLRPFDF